MYTTLFIPTPTPSIQFYSPYSHSTLFDTIHTYLADLNLQSAAHKAETLPARLAGTDMITPSPVWPLKITTTALDPK